MDSIFLMPGKQVWQLVFVIHSICYPDGNWQGTEIVQVAGAIV